MSEKVSISSGSALDFNPARGLLDETEDMGSRFLEVDQEVFADEHDAISASIIVKSNITPSNSNKNNPSTTGVEIQEQQERYDSPGYLLWEHGSFFLGALLGTVEACLHVHMDKAAASVDPDGYPEDRGEDFQTEPLVGPWDLLQLLNIISLFLYFLDAVVHLCTVDPKNENYMHRCSMILFGSAAVAELISSFCDVQSTDYPVLMEATSTLTGFAGAYLFFGSALTNLARHRDLCVHWEHHKSESSAVWKWWSTVYGRALGIFVGDVMFLAGTFCDLIVVHLAGETNQDYLQISLWALFACLVWLVDSMIYILADVLSSITPREKPQPHDLQAVFLTNPVPA